MTTIYFTVDGCIPSTNHLHYLAELKSSFPSFKATIFVPLFQCDISYLDQLSSLGYLEVACFGLNGGGREMAWFRSKNHLAAKLNLMEAQYGGHYVKGFKAPQFAYTQDTYELLLDMGYWLIEHPYNKNVVLSGLQYYKYRREANTIYYCGHAKNNGTDNFGLDQYFDNITKQISDADSIIFKYVSESLETA